MLRKWDFIHTGNPNDRLLVENTKTLQFVPTLTNFVGILPTNNNGLITLYGPLCYIQIHLTGGAIFGWTGASRISIPISPFVGLGWPNQPVHGPVQPNTGVLQNTNKNVPTIIYNSGSPYILMNDTSINNVQTDSFIYGWYYRN